MTGEGCWIPDLERFEDYNNSWEAYQEALYSIFKSDFIDSRPELEGKRVVI